LRKPESTAQPGEAIPVQVAAFVQNAEGAENLKRVSLFSSFRQVAGKEAAQVG
jgi:hypothetical protein